VIVAADRSLDAARAAFLPSIQVGARGGYVDSTLIADPVRIFSIGGSTLAPLFEGGRLRAGRCRCGSQGSRGVLLSQGGAQFFSRSRRAAQIRTTRRARGDPRQTRPQQQSLPLQVGE